MRMMLITIGYLPFNQIKIATMTSSTLDRDAIQLMEQLAELICKHSPSLNEHMSPILAIGPHVFLSIPLPSSPPMEVDKNLTIRTSKVNGDVTGTMSCWGNAIQKDMDFGNIINDGVNSVFAKVLPYIICEVLTADHTLEEITSISK